MRSWAIPRGSIPIRRAIPVYSVNIAAVVAVQAALEDSDHVRDYLRQVKDSKTLLYAACERLGLTYWKSDANFVLVRTGEHTEAVLSTAMARGVYLRDRSTGARLRRLHPHHHRHRRSHAAGARA